MTYLKIPDVSKPPSPDGTDDYTIIPLYSDQNRIREIGRIAKTAREGVFRKNSSFYKKNETYL